MKPSKIEPDEMRGLKPCCSLACLTGKKLLTSEPMRAQICKITGTGCIPLNGPYAVLEHLNRMNTCNIA